MNPYESCPVFEDDNFKLRLIEAGDTEGLLKVYSDEKAVPFFNSDNCHGDDFHYTTRERIDQAIEYWLWEYERRGFVRWAIVSKNEGEAVGTIELFHRVSEDAFNGCGLLRLDLRSDYENEPHIYNILSLINPSVYEMFDCEMIVTKIPPAATDRRAAAEKLGFKASDIKLVGEDKTEYSDYFVCDKIKQ